MANSTPSDGTPRIVRFRPRAGGTPSPQPEKHDGAEADLAAYARSPEDPAEYRRRQAVNAAVFLFVVLLIGAAIWLADTMADMRRNQDCVLSGRRGCSPVDYDRTVR
ncbi:MAG TPA: hypothetical protein VG270_00425 [Pseudolabrys sp.]|nr:hypothetical protein [Pseudolabrys sp.]